MFYSPESALSIVNIVIGDEADDLSGGPSDKDTHLSMNKRLQFNTHAVN